MASPMPVLPLVASITVWPRLELSGPLCVLDDTEGETILDGTERV